MRDGSSDVQIMATKNISSITKCALGHKAKLQLVKNHGSRNSAYVARSLPISKSLFMADTFGLQVLWPSCIHSTCMKHLLCRDRITARWKWTDPCWWASYESLKGDSSFLIVSPSTKSQALSCLSLPHVVLELFGTFYYVLILSYV